MTIVDTTRVIQWEEVAKHNTPEDAWVVAQGRVYDISGLEGHPGGQPVLAAFAGQDASSHFKHHRQKARWSKRCIGVVPSACVIM